MTMSLFTPIRYGSLRVAVILALLFSVLALPAAASEGLHMVPISLEERTKAADMIVEGEVVAQRSFWDARRENIYTAYTIRLFKIFKGEVREKQLEVITEGGAVGLTRHEVSSALKLNRGQQGLFFLTKGSRAGIAPKPNAPVLSPYASRQGFIRYDIEKATAADPFTAYHTVQEVYRAVTTRTGRSFSTVLENKQLESGILKQSQQQKATEATQAPIVTTFTPTLTSAGTNTVLTINGTNFGSSQGNGFVEFRNADDGGKTLVRPYLIDYVSWTNTQIQVRIPSVTPTGGPAGTGPIKVTANDGTSASSAGSLTIEFAYSNVVAERGITPVQPQLIDANRSGGYTIQFAPSMQSRAAAREGFRRAMNSWICSTNINWTIGTPATSESVSDDTRSVIRFAPGSETGQGVLARTTSRYRGCPIAGDTIFWLTEFDMEINSNINWQYGPGSPGLNQFDFETVVLHELGHAHQLGHVILDNAIMHYAIESRRIIRDLGAADLRGANLVMARSQRPPACGGRSPIVPKTDGDCNLAPEIFTFDASFGASGVVNLNWTSSTEANVDYYVVQRSQNGQDWESLGEVDAKGPGNYTFTDSSPLPRKSYYRIRVVYNDTSEAFSARAQVINPDDMRMLKVYPNPIGLNANANGTPSEVLQLEYMVNATTVLSLSLYDIQGKLVQGTEVTVTDDASMVDINVSALAAGTYLLRWSEGNNSGTVKVVKL